jgi:hypothetical protein
MFLPLITAWIASLPACCLPLQATVSADDPVACAGTVVLRVCSEDGQTVRTRVITGGDAEDGSGHAFAYACADDSEDEPIRVLARTYADAGEELPKVWIGVRVTPVPAPLAAHIGANGVMISNVVKESPADKAGLEQYDVIVAIDGQNLGRPQDLTAAVAKAEPDKAAQLSIVRKGARQELAITPVARPQESDWSLKYAEPEDSVVDDAVKMYGRALQLGPKGHWIMRDLGQLHDVPDALNELKDHLDQFNIKIDKLPNAGDMDLRILRGLGDAETADADADAGTQVEIRIKVGKDGQTTTIVREADGKFEVTREAAEGQESSTTYDTRAEFEAGDPEAFKMYSEQAVCRGGNFIEVHPGWDKLGSLRHEFQINVEQKVKAALERAKEATAEARDKQHEALQELHEKLAQTRIEVHKSPDAAGAETLIVRVNDDGSIKVVVTKDGEKQTYEFKDKAEFKAVNPELYERAGKLLE